MKPAIKALMHKGVPIRLYSIGWMLRFCGISKNSYLNYLKRGFPEPVLKIDPNHRYFTAAELVHYSQVFKAARQSVGGKQYARKAIAECAAWRERFIETFTKLTHEQLMKLADRPNVLTLQNDVQIQEAMTEESIRKIEEGLKLIAQNEKSNKAQKVKAGSH